MKGQKTVVEFGTSKIACATALQRQKIGLEILGHVQIPYAGIKNANWANATGVQDVLERAVWELEKQSGSRIKSVDIGLPGCFTKITSSTTQTDINGKVTSKDIGDLMQKADTISLLDDQMVVDTFPSWFILDDGEIYLDATGLRAQSVMACISFVLANKYFVNDVRQLLKNAGVRLEGMHCEPMAQAMTFIPEEKRDSIAILADIGYYNTNISLVYGDSILHHVTVEMGGGHITNDIAYIMKVDVQTAEQIKRRYSFGLQESNKILHLYAKDSGGKLNKYPYDLLKNVIDARVEHILRYVSDFTAKAEKRMNRKVSVYITGGGVAYMPGANNFIRMCLGRVPSPLRLENSVLSTPGSQGVYALLEYAFGRGNEAAYIAAENKSFFGRLSGKLFE
jgi:cell division protein FtsA